MNARTFSLLFAAPCLAMTLSTAHAQTDMQPVGKFDIDRTEVTIGQFRQFVNASKMVTHAETAGGGSTFENGWEQRRGWVWHSPFGQPGSDDEPVTHVTFDEAQRFCQWTGRRLPTDAEWGEAAYVERREKPTAGFVTGQRYRYPTGDSPRGANCLGDCGGVRTVSHAVTSRGRGHARVASTAAGVNGLFDMGGNLWEWVAAAPAATSARVAGRGGTVPRRCATITCKASPQTPPWCTSAFVARGTAGSAAGVALGRRGTSERDGCSTRRVAHRNRNVRPST